MLSIGQYVRQVIFAIEVTTNLGRVDFGEGPVSLKISNLLVDQISNTTGGGCPFCRLEIWPYFGVDLVIWTLNFCRFGDLEIGVDGDLAILKL